MSDPEVLRRAAVILRRESAKPKAIGLAVICNMLNDLASKVEAKQRASRDN